LNKLIKVYCWNNGSENKSLKNQQEDFCQLRQLHFFFQKKLSKVHSTATHYKRKILWSGASVPKRLSTEKRNLELHPLPGALSKGQGK
jgi:hypothetical protein